jgi:hypothetical protein
MEDGGAGVPCCANPFGSSFFIVVRLLEFWTSEAQQGKVRAHAKGQLTVMHVILRLGDVLSTSCSLTAL